jgi:isopentenyl diphosphate isomerase/L-lactate dehydrogenase-like FMN-dependent dehydrogenase
MVHKDGELASAKAAAELGQLFTLSSSSTFSIEEVVKATDGKGKMLLEIDIRLKKEIRDDLI